MATSTTLGLEPQPTPPKPPAKKTHFILGLFGIALGLFLAFFRAWVWSYGVVDAQMLGNAAGGATLPALIAYLIAGRKSVWNPARLGRWFCGLSIFFFIVTNQHPVSLQEHIGNLMKEAAGAKPVDNSGPSMDVPIRDMMRDVFEERKAMELDQARFAPELGKLYTVESFSNRDAMQRSVDAVRGVVAVDQKYSQQLASLPERMQARADRSGLSDSFKAEFMDGIRKAYGESRPLTIHRQAAEIENEWADATVVFYEFAMANAAQIRVEGSHLVIGKEHVRTGFNERMKKSRMLRDRLTEMNTQMESAQRELLRGMGVTPKEMGLKDTAPPDEK